MIDQSFFEDTVSQLAEQSDAVGLLAQDSGGFAAVFAAFESKDPMAFRWVLERLDMLSRCELICEWVRTKWCVLRCIEVCGPIRELAAETKSKRGAENAAVPDLREFARAIVRLASNEKLLRQAVDAVSCGNGEEFHAAIGELKLQPFCRLLCHYVCSIVYHRVCEVVCTPQPVIFSDPALEIRADARAITEMLAKEKAFAAISKAAIAFDCGLLRTAIDRAGFISRCEIICRLFCTWRCVWTCTELCRVRTPILTGVYAIEEAREFALASRQLAGHPRALGDLVAAVEKRDVKAYGEIISRFGLGSYCYQVCGWVCSRVCFEFCYCVCPPPQLFPEFTKIGAYEYQTQIDSALPATGLTLGSTKAFFSTLRLNGILTQTLGGQPLEYSFEYLPIKIASTTLKNAITAADTSIVVASSAGFPAAPFNVVIGSVGSYNAGTNTGTPGYEIVTVTAVAATTWTVVRGQQGTTAAPAAAGALIVTGAAAAGSWTQIPSSWIRNTVIGQAEVFVSGHWEFPNVEVQPNTAEVPAPIPAPFTSDGWIQVPQGSNIFLNGNMINLDSTALPSFPAADETGVSASNPANHPLPTDLYFGIRMRVRQHGSATSSDGGTCNVVAIDNTPYNNVNHHPEWDGGVTSGQYAVVMVDIKELQSAGCAGITNSLTVLFTASHPNLGPVSINMIGPGGPYGFTLPTPIPETGDWYGTAANNFDITKLTPCAYIVTLSVLPLLTNGDLDFGPPLIDQIAFCLAGTSSGSSKKG